MYLPKQKKSKSEKNREWKLECLKSIGGYNYTNLGVNSTSGMYTDNIIKELRIASGDIGFTDYSHIINPYNLQGDAYKQYSDKLRNYDIVSPLFLKQISNFIKAPFNPIVYTKNSNFQNEKLEYKKQLINEMLQQKFVNKLIETGQLTESQPVEELTPDAIDSLVNSVKDIETIEGQNILDYVIERDRFKLQYAKEFFHFIATNRAFSYSTVRGDNVVRYTVHPAIIDYTYTESTFIDDASIVRARYKFSIEDVIEIFQDHEDIKNYYPNLFNELEEKSKKLTTSTPQTGLTRGFEQQTVDLRYIDVHHCEWTSFRRVGFVGEVEVDEDYGGDDVANWTWREEIREGYILNNEYYLGGDCVEFPVYDSNNKFKAKKSYNGVIFMNDLTKQLSLSYKIAQYQEAYNVIKFKLQTTIVKNMGKIGIIPIGIFKEEGVVNTSSNNIREPMTSQEEMEFLALKQEEASNRDTNSPIAKALYRANATGLLFVDSEADGFAEAINALKSVDLESYQLIGLLQNYAASIKEELEAILGFNRYSNGEIGTRESNANVQEGLSQAGAVIDLYYSYFEAYIANDLQRVIDLSKHAFKKGTNITYLRNNQEIVNLEVSDGYSNISHGIFVSSSRKAQQLLDITTAKATEFLQNGMEHSTMLKMLSSSKNFASIIQDVEEAEQRLNKRQQEADQAQQKHEAEMKQAEMAEKEKDRELKKYEADLKAELEIQKQALTALSFESASNKTDDYARIMEQQQKSLDSIRDFKIKQSELELKNKDIDTKKYAADIQLQVAKENKPKQT